MAHIRREDRGRSDAANDDGKIKGPPSVSKRVLVTEAEVDVLEAWLGHVLDELPGSP